ncbi:hypothetical protein JW921_11505, partial [Candidatus Fermentibacterales bacterium]|nr:hypothetical protein [Candidatus Fermentibacterales bacterium]
DRPVTILELIGRREQAGEPELSLVGRYAEALGAYREGEFERAAGLFDGIPDDTASAIMAGRCRRYVEPGFRPGPDWDGTWDLTSK